MTTELEALQAIHDSLTGLEDAQARDRVLRWAFERFASANAQSLLPLVDKPKMPSPSDGGPDDAEDASNLGSRARLWSSRHGVALAQVQHLFVDHGEGLELTLETLPGKTAKERVRNAYLLTGVMRLLQRDSSEFSDSHARDLCRRYACYDKTNHQKALRASATLFSGDGQTWRLTPAGERVGAELVKSASGQT
jgi:hypothetical protein